ncbi:MAG: hypothetical protein U0L48_06720, partial [Acutalibacteraceae bacterium]|nr:hypothetical protein [Acutalibacteraceae bacterium]
TNNADPLELSGFIIRDLTPDHRAEYTHACQISTHHEKGPYKDRNRTSGEDQNQKTDNKGCSYRIIEKINLSFLAKQITLVVMQIELA